MVLFKIRSLFYSKTNLDLKVRGLFVGGHFTGNNLLDTAHGAVRVSPSTGGRGCRSLPPLQPGNCITAMIQLLTMSVVSGILYLLVLFESFISSEESETQVFG